MNYMIIPIFPVIEALCSSAEIANFYCPIICDENISSLCEYFLMNVFHSFDNLII